MLENAQRAPVQRHSWCISSQVGQSHVRGAKLMDACSSPYLDLTNLPSTAMMSTVSVDNTPYPDISKRVGDIGCASEGHK